MRRGECGRKREEEKTDRHQGDKNLLFQTSSTLGSLQVSLWESTQVPGPVGLPGVGPQALSFRLDHVLYTGACAPLGP